MSRDARLSVFPALSTPRSPSFSGETQQLSHAFHRKKRAKLNLGPNVRPRLRRDEFTPPLCVVARGPV